MRLFASHDWGVNGANHARVREVVEALRQAGHAVWFDENEMKGNLLDDMCNGIDNCDAILIFVTANYIQKIASGNDRDNCRREFMYAQRRHGTRRMVTIRFESHLQSKWNGPIGMLLGERLYVDMSQDHTSSTKIDELIRLLPEDEAPVNVVTQAFNCGKNTMIAKRALCSKILHSPRSMSPRTPRSPRIVSPRVSPVRCDKPVRIDQGDSKIPPALCVRPALRERVDKLVKCAGLSTHENERMHERLERLLKSIGIDGEAEGIPFHEKIARAEIELGM